MRASGSPLFMRLISSLFALSFLLVLQGYLFHAQGQGRKFTREQRQQQKQLRRRHNADRANLLSSLESQGRNATETAGVSRANWRGMPGAAKDIGIGVNGTVWIIGANKTQGGYGIYRWREDRWQGIDGGAVRIAVDTYGNPWVVNSARRILRRVYKRAGNEWIEMPGRATDIGIGANGAVWVIGANKTPGGFGIYRWVKNRWKGVDGGAVRIAVGPKGNPWVVNSGGKISKRANNKWIGMPGRAKDIGIGTGGVVWMIGANRVAGGFGIFRLNGNKWFEVGGGAVQISVGPGIPWIVNSDNKIFSVSSGGQPVMVSSFSGATNLKRLNQQERRHQIEMQQLKQRQLGLGGPPVNAGRPGPSQQFTPAQLQQQRRMQKQQAQSYRSLRERHRQERRAKGGKFSAAERNRQLQQFYAQQRQHRMQLMRLQQRQLAQNRGQGTK